MCGIVGYVGLDKASPMLLRGLTALEYRGYDSCGIATLANGKIWCKKGVGKVADVEKAVNFGSLPGSVGISHTRWSTHGIPSERNAHPHFDCNRDIAVVHNGIISNYAELKKTLQVRGHRFESDTDTEVFAHLIEEHYKGNLERAVAEALKQIEGTYAFLVISRRENKIVCAKKESPLVLGLNGNSYFVGSDIASFYESTNVAVPLDDGEMAVLTPSGYVITDARGEIEKKQSIDIDWKREAVRRGSYAHYMLKEIMEQPQTLKTSMKICAEEIKKLAQWADAYERVYITAIGTSLHAAQTAEYWFSQIAGKAVQAVDSSEFASRAVVDSGTLVISITQSGESYDTLSAMRHAKSHGAKTATIVNVAGSSATREAELVVMQGSGPEMAVCATKTFASQLAVLLRTALELGKIRNRDVSWIENEFQKMPSCVKTVAEQSEKIREIVEKRLGVKNYMFIGRGINAPTSSEAALKFKEITYLHAEGMSGGMLKHGTISLIDKDMQTVAFIPREERKILSNIEEIKARGGFVLAIASGYTVHGDAMIEVPETIDMLSPFVFMPAYQLLAYHMAVKLGNDVDRPRALAKSVTVE